MKENCFGLRLKQRSESNNKKKRKEDQKMSRIEKISMLLMKKTNN